MDQVPKILHALTSQWSNSSYTVSFKLETDDRLLIPKARASLERYGHQLVVGNELNTRKWKVVFVHSPASSSATTTTTGGDGGEEWIVLEGGESAAEEGGKEIEEEIVKRLAQRHGSWIDAGGNAT